MKADRELIEHVARLARIELTDEEKERFVPQLREVLELFSKLDKADTAGILPSFQPVLKKDAMRQDAKGECLRQEDAIGLSGHTKDGYFKGPKVI